jgi:hypothetical protein
MVNPCLFIRKSVNQCGCPVPYGFGYVITIAASAFQTISVSLSFPASYACLLSRPLPAEKILMKGRI